MVTDWTVQKFLDETSSAASTPGGGSLSALVGALAAALNGMVCYFTTGRKKFADVESEVNELLDRAESLRARLTACIQADIDTYGRVSQAYKMPKNTREERRARKTAIDSTMREAARVPVDVAEAALESLRVSSRLLEIGNRQLIGDIACASAFANAAIEGAVTLARYNLKLIGDEGLTREIAPKLDELVAEADAIHSAIREEVSRCLAISA